MRRFGIFSGALILLTASAPADDCVFSQVHYPADALGINRVGDVAGSETVGSQIYPYLYVDGFLIRFGVRFGTPGQALAVSWSRLAVGWFQPQGYTVRRAFLYDLNQDTLIDLGSLGGGTSMAYDVNSAGHAVGEALTWWGATHAFYWDYHNRRLFDIHPNDSEYSGAFAMTTDNYAATGAYGSGSGYTGMFLYSGGGMTDLGYPGYRPTAMTNNTRRIVGYSDSPPYRAFLLDTGTFTLIPLPQGFTENLAHDVNESGVVVGECRSQDYTCGFMYRDGVVRAITPPQRNARIMSINNRGIVAGYEPNPTGGGYRAFTLDFQGDLNCDGSVNPFDINPFVLALADPLAYAQQYQTCDIQYGDMDDDGSVNAFDINGFIARLSACP